MRFHVKRVLASKDESVHPLAILVISSQAGVRKRFFLTPVLCIVGTHKTLKTQRFDSNSPAMLFWAMRLGQTKNAVRRFFSFLT